MGGSGGGHGIQCYGVYIYGRYLGSIFRWRAHAHRQLGGNSVQINLGGDNMQFKLNERGARRHTPGSSRLRLGGYLTAQGKVGGGVAGSKNSTKAR